MKIIETIKMLEEKGRSKDAPKLNLTRVGVGLIKTTARVVKRTVREIHNSPERAATVCRIGKGLVAVSKEESVKAGRVLVRHFKKAYNEQQ